MKRRKKPAQSHNQLLGYCAHCGKEIWRGQLLAHVHIDLEYHAELNRAIMNAAAYCSRGHLEAEAMDREDKGGWEPPASWKAKG